MTEQETREEGEKESKTGLEKKEPDYTEPDEPSRSLFFYSTCAEKTMENFKQEVTSLIYN